MVDAKRSMRGVEYMEAPKPGEFQQSVPTTETPYNPPQVETVVTAADLERETLYGGIGPYGIPPP